MQIGSIQLDDFEVPASITFGGRHRLAVHKSATGTRTIDHLGPDDIDIQFRGIFSGKFAESRARALNDLRLRGEPVWLSWNSFRYRVIVKSTTLNYRTTSWILYQVSCLIVDQPGVVNTSGQKGQAQLISDWMTTTAVAASLGLDLSALSSIFASGSTESLGSTARAALSSQISRCRAILSDTMAAPLPSLQNGTEASDSFPGEFNSALLQVGGMANATTASGYLGRIARLL